MALRAKKPEVREPRLKALVFASEGSGKTHMCCSFPDTYYIDTEGLEDHPQFVKMIRDNGGDLVYLTELSEIIEEVKSLISTKHTYKTLVIDSISFPYGWLSQIEADRLGKKKDNEGTEFGANLAKAKRMTFQLGILLSRLDMNVLVTAHEKTKYEKNVEVEKTYDITDKMAYSLGSVWNLKMFGNKRKLFIKKSRYTEMKTGDSLDFEESYEVIKNLFGEGIFKREAKTEELATKEQIVEFNRLTALLNISEERVNKVLTNAKCVTLEEMNREYINKVIVQLQNKIQGEAA
jgi:hypothetical protein